VRDSGQHTSSELTWLGPASARRSGPQQGDPGHEGEAAQWSKGRRLGPACCRGGRATRRRLQQVRLLFRGGDFTTDGSGLGVGVPGSGCSGFAAATHRRMARRTCSFGLLHERPPDSDTSTTMAWTAPAPSSPPSPSVFIFTNGDTVAPAQRRRPRTIAAPGFSPASCASFLPPTPSPPF
jgi:hypothetical protein